MALTDINNTSCAYQYIRACKKQGIKPILGIEYRQIKSQAGKKLQKAEEENVTQKRNMADLEVPVQNTQYVKYLYTGIARNNEGWRELNHLLTRCSLDGHPLPEIAPAMEHAYIIYRSLPKGKSMSDLRDNEYIGVRPDEVNKLFSSYLRDYLDKLVVFAPITFLDKDGYKVHKLLRCIDLNIVIGKLDKNHCAKASEGIYTPNELNKIYENYPSDYSQH